MTVGRSAGEKDNGLSFLTELPLGRLTPRGRAFYYPKGAIVRDGDPAAEAAWFISSGTCELRRNHKTGVQAVLRHFGPGDAFATCEDVRTSEVVVATSDSVLLCFDKETLQLLRSECADVPVSNNGNGHTNGNGNGNGQDHHNGNGHSNGNGNGTSVSLSTPSSAEIASTRPLRVADQS